MLVNGGGAVTLQFQRSPFRPLTRTVFVPWNQVFIVLKFFREYNAEKDVLKFIFETNL